MKKQEQIFPIMKQGEGLVEIKESEFTAYWDAHILEGGKLFLFKDGQHFDFTKHQEKVMHLLDPKKKKDLSGLEGNQAIKIMQRLNT